MIDFFKKNRTIILLAVFILLGFILRMFYLAEIKRIPFFDHPVADARIYFDRAMEIRDGKVFPEDVSFHSSPLYPYYIALTYSLTGSLAGPRIIQMLTGILNIAVIFLITRILFGTVPGLIAAFFMSVYPIFIYFEGDLMMIPLVLFTLNLSCLMFVLYQVHRQKRYIALGGFFLALTAMGKPDTIMLAPFLACFVFFTEKNLKEKIRRVALLTLCVCLTLLPLVVTNYMVEKRFVLLTSNGGVNFYIGNHKGADGLFSLPEKSGLWDHRLYLSSKESAEREMGKRLTSSEVSKFWFKKGMRFIVTDFGEFLQLLGKKTLLMINRFEVSNHHSFYFFKKFSNILKINPLQLSFFVLFGAVGLILSFRNRKNFILLYGYSAILFLFTVIFFVTSRYRLPVVPFIIIFASFGIYESYICVRKKDYKKLIVPGITGLIIFLISLPKFADFSTNLNQDYNNLGNVYLSIKQYDKAIRCYERVERKNPKSFFSNFNKGNVYKAKKQYEIAISEYLKEIKKNPKFAGAYYNAGYVYREMGNIKKAIFYLEKAKQIEPSEDCFVNLGYLYNKEGRHNETIAIFEEGIKLYPNSKLLLNGLRVCYINNGEPKKAEKMLKRLIELDKRHK